MSDELTCEHVLQPVTANNEPQELDLFPCILQKTRDFWIFACSACGSKICA